MNVGQILLPGASEYERKCQRIDHEILARQETVHLCSDSPDGASSPAAQLRQISADLAHVYGNPSSHASLIRGFPVPWVASRAPRVRRFFIGRTDPPPLIAGPLTEPALPEAVEEQYFSVKEGREAAGGKARYTIGSYGPSRHGVSSLTQRTIARLERFRQDIDWMMFDAPPSREQLAELDLWVDPASDETDYDGFTAEALVAGMRVVACRTAINRDRLAEGSGFAVPIEDPNELAHAIVTALFKDEIAGQRLEAAAAQSGRFDPSVRSESLLRLYNQILHERSA
ncbi:MAG TPA: hypothetical protein VMS12_08140 [Thermoanaerobaculia bacterium]|nr:hypothetical protein [Thermoanaerobaculia bacterium]